ncbi:hypothetical protein [Cupriavidus necator]|uniref:hypothetical protein n=1 Tax=Cupriavidus necator TaxID=106590 RepID=UPI00339D796E
MPISVRLPAALSRPRAYALFEALCGLALFSTGLAALATLGPPGLGWLRAQEGLVQATRTAVEFAETSGWLQP